MQLLNFKQEPVVVCEGIKPLFVHETNCLKPGFVAVRAAFDTCVCVCVCVYVCLSQNPSPRPVYLPRTNHALFSSHRLFTVLFVVPELQKSLRLTAHRLRHRLSLDLPSH